MSDPGSPRRSPAFIQAEATSRAAGLGKGRGMSASTISGCVAGAGPYGYALRTMTNPRRAAQNRQSPVGARHRASH
jgi:hypothetical protein